MAHDKFPLVLIHSTIFDAADKTLKAFVRSNPQRPYLTDSGHRRAYIQYLRVRAKYLALMQSFSPLPNGITVEADDLGFDHNGVRYEFVGEPLEFSGPILVQ